MTRFMFAAAIGATIATAASATPSVRLEGVSRAYVSYRDLNLQSEAGRSSLIRRIHHAADAVCPDNSNLMPFAELRGRCYRAAIASGLDQMNAIVAR